MRHAPGSHVTRTLENKRCVKPLCRREVRWRVRLGTVPATSTRSPRAHTASPPFFLGVGEWGRRGAKQVGCQ